MSCFVLTVPCESEIFQRLLEENEEGISIVAEDGLGRIYAETRLELELLLSRFSDAESSSIQEVVEDDWRDIWSDSLPDITLPGLPFSIVSSCNEREREGAVVLNPGRSFGIGHHETTQAVLRLMAAAAQSYPSMFQGARVLDVGCGSGVLGIVAAKFGAENVIFIDNDPEALRVTEENVRQNGIRDFKVTSTLSPQYVEQSQIILINILLNVSSQLAPLLVKPGITIFGSGFLTEQAEEFAKVFRLEKSYRLTVGEWSGLLGVVPPNG